MSNYLLNGNCHNAYTTKPTPSRDNVAERIIFSARDIRRHYVGTDRRRAFTACGKTLDVVIVRSPPFSLADDEGSVQLLDFTTAEILLPQGGIRMTVWRGLSAACFMRADVRPVAPRPPALEEEPEAQQPSARLPQTGNRVPQTKSAGERSSTDLPSKARRAYRAITVLAGPIVAACETELEKQSGTRTIYKQGCDSARRQKIAMNSS